MSATRPHLPPAIEEKLARARRLEWWTLFWLATIVAVMAVVMGGSQAMQAAWIEDMLSLLPPALFLLACRVERMGASEHYPFGLDRIGSLCFLLAAAALAVMGGYLVYDAGRVLILQEHPTIGTFTLFGTTVWQGWVMIAALTYSVIPPVILGHRKRQIAPDLMDKVLHTDAEMNAADWKTGLAGIAGIIGIALGWWWADAVAAGIIGFDILRDGITCLRSSVAELLDGAPRQLENSTIHPQVGSIEREFGPDRRVRVRETGRFLHVEVADGDELRPDPARAAAALGEQAWRIVAVTGPAPEPLRRGEASADEADGDAAGAEAPSSG